MSDDAILLKEPPHSMEAEQALLGALLMDNEAFDRIPFLKVENFYRDDHRRIFKCMREMHERGRHADLVTVSEALKASGDLEKASGPAYLGELAQHSPGSFNAHRYAEMVREKSILRELAQRGTEIAEKALAGITDPLALAEEAEASILSIMDSGSGGEIVHIGQAVTEYLEYVDEHPKGIETGLSDLDAMTGGLLPGNLIVIAGRPHMGKTSCALQMAEEICETKPGLMFSLEASRREVAGRLIEWHKHRLGRDAAVDKIYKLKLFVDDSSSVSPGIIRSRLRRFKRQHGLTLLVVDYLQLVDGTGDSREQQVAFISRQLKKIAKEFEIPVIALAQLNRKVEDRTDKRPHMSDLRESGSIEADADLILLLYRPDYYDQACEVAMPEAEILCVKNRNTGRTGTVKVMFNRELGRFGNYDPMWNRERVA